jgi:hypothetical protein
MSTMTDLPFWIPPRCRKSLTFWFRRKRQQRTKSFASKPAMISPTLAKFSCCSIRLLWPSVTSLIRLRVNKLHSRPGRYVNSHFKRFPLLTPSQLCHPVSHFRGRSMGDIERELGEINKDFLYNKAALYFPKDELIDLQGDDGQGRVLVVFSELEYCSTDLRSSQASLSRDSREYIVCCAKYVCRSLCYQTNSHCAAAGPLQGCA